jgi:hypothetical protein
MNDETQTIGLTRAELDDLLDAAAQRGASKALDQLGLTNDPDTKRDLYEIRTLISDWRDVKSSALHFFGKVLAVSILGALAFVATGKWWASP